MPYAALPKGKIQYVGNNIHPSSAIDFKAFETSCFSDRIARVKNERAFFHIANIDNAIFNATVDYFRSIGARWTNLPLTTLMISSPGEVYAGQKLDYTTDTLPVEIPDWFGAGKRIFLSESSQFYLELQLLISGIDKVFSIYNSFRKEASDATHLSEFQHIEFEGKLDSEGNIQVFLGLFNHITHHVFEKCAEDVLFFISPERLDEKRSISSRGPVRMSFDKALRMLYEDTKDEKYLELSLRHFGTWEEVRLTELAGGNVLVDEFPMMQIPFYHAVSEKIINGCPLAKNADFILSGYRETIGSGERVASKEALMKKAEIFNLPESDYLPYLRSRDFDDYSTTSGFGLGWQRLVQWITDQPYIYESTVFPRTHLLPNP